VWRSLGGGDDHHGNGKDVMLTNGELGEHYCLRGLEPYQSAARNAEMHSLRYLYTASILNEQDRLHSLYEGKHDPFLVSGQVAHLSHRAMQEARLLALQDEKDARGEEEESDVSTLKQRKRNSNGAPSTSHRRKSSMSRRHTMNHTFTSTEGSATNTSGAKGAAPVSLSPPSTTRNKVDVTLLKEMNAQFLQTLMASRQTSSLTSTSSLSAPSGSTKLGGKDADMGRGVGGGGSMALSSLMWNSGHPAARHLQMTAPAAAPSTMNGSAMAVMRRHSLDLDTNVERNEAIMSQPFLAIRRDSLHCLLSTASSSSSHSA
jgi:hypothetical protein